MGKQTNVLVFPAGEINSVEIHDALATCVNVKVFGGASVDRHGPYIFKNYISGIPFINDDHFISEFNKVISEYGIDLIFPTHDTVAQYFAEMQDKITAKVIVAPKETADICRDKEKTYELFRDCDFIPKLYKNKNEDIAYPVFAKPKIGQGSVGAHKIDDIDALTKTDFNENVVAEYLPGKEYTVDCLTDKKGDLVLAMPRSRDRTMAGISVNGKNHKTTATIQRIAETINSKLTFSGLWFFQIKESISGEPKLLEISTRTAGTMCLTRAQGANLPLMSVYIALGYDVKPLLNHYSVTLDRTLINRYKIDYEYENVYLDFDDTVLMGNQLHLYSILYIYQCLNLGKHIYLLTRHAEDILATLEKYKIDKNIFEDIIHITDMDHKINYIKPDKAIFIDNSFQERELVSSAYNIPVFDVDMIEVLLDWRT